MSTVSPVPRVAFGSAPASNSFSTMVAFLLVQASERGVTP